MVIALGEAFMKYHGRREKVAKISVPGGAAVTLGLSDTQRCAKNLEAAKRTVANIHDWQVKGKLIGGYMEVGQNFPLEPGKAVEPGKVDTKVEAFIPVRSLRSVEKDGSPYNTKMDDIMYEKLLSPPHSRIIYRDSELVLKEPAKAKDAPYVFDPKGELVVAGVTNKISMPVNVLPLGDKKLKVSGSTAVKMTAFGIQPPAPAIALGMIKTGDDVKLLFEWSVAQKAPAATGSK